MFQKSNLKEWFDRYKYAEIAAITAAIISSLSGGFFEGLTAAYIITFAEYVAFYSILFLLSYHRLMVANQLFNKEM